MGEQRDFKGVWIPKDIWLSKDLTMLEKVIFVEIDSLDNEDNCIAGNEYFAKFCNCSESAVSKAISKLQELNLIEVINFDGRHRKVRVVNSTKQPSKICYADYENLRPININNNTINKVSISKDIDTPQHMTGKDNFLGSIKTTKQENDNQRVNKFLNMYRYRNELPQIKVVSETRKKNILRILNKYSENDIATVLDNFNTSDFLLGKVSDFKANIDWILNENNFIKVLEGKYNNGSTSKNMTVRDKAISDTYTDAELQALDKLDAERRANGLQTKF